MLTKSEIIKTKTSEIWIDENAILRVNVMEGAELTYEEVAICFESYAKLGCGSDNKVLQLMDARVNSSMTKEGREYVAKQAKHFFIASAVITNNLPVRLIANFFIKFYRLNIPVKIFDSKEKALEWLLKFRK
jgi:hypothetical protein